MTTPAKLQVTSVVASKHLQFFEILLYMPSPIDCNSANKVMVAWLRRVFIALPRRLLQHVLCGNSN
jgi:hypothetical protein